MSDAYFQGLQEGATKGEQDAKEGLLDFPIPPVSINLLEPGYSKGYEEGYKLAYKTTALKIDSRAARLKADRLARELIELEQDQELEFANLKQAGDQRIDKTDRNADDRLER